MAKLVLLTGLVLLLNTQIDSVPLRELLAQIRTTDRPTTTTTTTTTTITTTPYSSTIFICDTHGPTSPGTVFVTGGSDFCAGKENGAYADPTNQRNFYICHAGKSHLNSCQEGLVFDSSCSCCKSP
ncbi:acidic mammalian chitinase-like [Heliangelus exortis]|uniref:acidic mammalian chitinase-like n=1 Tax=Heliangelus exortis TaxID=472823 RepID=UPI003A8F1366